MNRNLVIALAVSLGVNLFVLGAGASLMVVRATGGQFGGGHPPPDPMGRTMRRLAPEDRQALRQSIANRQAKIDGLRAQARLARQEIGDLLEAPQVDRPAMTAAMARVRADDVAVRAEIEEAVVEVLAGLPKERRAGVADMIRRGPGGGRHGHEPHSDEGQSSRRDD